jgi:transketolase
VCDTIKGKGVSFMEDVVDWHGVAPTAEQAQVALAEIAAR